MLRNKILPAPKSPFLVRRIHSAEFCYDDFLIFIYNPLTSPPPNNVIWFCLILNFSTMEAFCIHLVCDLFVLLRDTFFSQSSFLLSFYYFMTNSLSQSLSWLKKEWFQSLFDSSDLKSSQTLLKVLF